ncbi:MAG: hypothetical protein KAZ88_03330 [Acidimicrobiia bacterium]|nr:hypothetical protein [Acidimicrobiia bacterium]
MAKKRTELEARLLEEHERVLTVVQRWQSEQQAVDEVRASLAVAEARLDQAVLEGADLGDRSMVARLLDLPEAQVRKAIAEARRSAKRRSADGQSSDAPLPAPLRVDPAVDASASSKVSVAAGRV